VALQVGFLGNVGVVPCHMEAFLPFVGQGVVHSLADSCEVAVDFGNLAHDLHLDVEVLFLVHGIVHDPFLLHHYPKQSLEGQESSRAALAARFRLSLHFHYCCLLWESLPQIQFQEQS